MPQPRAVGPGSLVCVTGANGYVASHLVRVLLREGYRVRGTVRDPADDAKTAHLRASADTLDAADRLELVAGDLLEEGSFDEAVRGCEGVFHAAAAVFFAAKDPQKELVDPSVRGTLNVLRSVAKAGTVRRVVHTSSIAAVYGFDKPRDHRFTEVDWNESSTLHVDAYGVAKVSAEREAVAFVEGLPEGRRFDLVRLNPGMVWGPPLIKQHCKASPLYIRDIVSNTIGGLAPIHFGVVDVRDLAEAHLLAMRTEAASGRYLCVGDHLWMPEIAERLQAMFPEVRVASRRLPKPVVLLAALIDKTLNFQQLRKVAGRPFFYDSTRARRELGATFRPVDETLKDTATVMIENGWARTTKR